MHKRGLIICIAIAICLLCLGCQTVQLAPALVVVNLATPEPTPVTMLVSVAREAALAEEAEQVTPTPAPTATATPEPTQAPTASPDDMPAPTAKAQTTAKADPSPKAAAKAADPPKASDTPTPKPTASPTPTPTPTPKAAAPLTPPPMAEEPVVVPGGNEVPSGSQYSAAEVELAAKTAYFEARGKGEAAYRAVICVILNRVESSKYGGGVTSVKTEVYRQSQFTVVNRSDFESTTPPDDVIGYANDVLNNNNRSIPTDVFFFRAEKEDKTWGSRVFYKTIGGNDFYYGG